MPTNSEYEVLREKYLRLRHAAEKVIEAADYTAGGDEPRVYASQLRDLKGELDRGPSADRMQRPASAQSRAEVDALPPHLR